MIKDGYSLVIFPEGTRSRSNHMSSFKHGSLKLATKAKSDHSADHHKEQFQVI